ncbi:MAG: SET domain-containing protein [Planctomycetia bacterium]
MPRRDTAFPEDTAAERRRLPPLARLVRFGETHVGRGVFARRPLRSGMILAEVEGRILVEPPADSSYVMELGSGRLLDPAAPLRFVNHSCDPNCELFYWEEDARNFEDDRLWLQTIRPIAAGEELSIDYAWPADAAIACRCRAVNCRGWIVDPAELDQIVPSRDPGAGT